MSRGLARALGARYLDTGAMYRIVTLAVLRAGVDLADAAAIGDAAPDVRWPSAIDPDEDRSYLDGEDVSARDPRRRGDQGGVGGIGGARRADAAGRGCSASWRPGRAASSSRDATSARSCCPTPT